MSVAFRMTTLRNALPTSYRPRVASARTTLISLKPVTTVIGNRSDESSVELLSQSSNGTKFTAMRHGVRTSRLGRPADQRKALIRSLVTEVLRHGTIKTTVVRAKYIRKYVDRMITLSKRGTMHAKRQMEAFVFDKDLVESVMKDAPARYAARQGGYCRVVRDLRVRRGDATEMATIELV